VFNLALIGIYLWVAVAVISVFGFYGGYRVFDYYFEEDSCYCCSLNLL